MPNPRKDETREKFLSRCIPYVMDREGITDRKHAAAKCYGIWRQYKKATQSSELKKASA